MRDQFIPYPDTLHVTVIGLISLVPGKERVKDKKLGGGIGVFSRSLTETPSSDEMYLVKDPRMLSRVNRSKQDQFNTR